METDTIGRNEAIHDALLAGLCNYAGLEPNRHARKKSRARRRTPGRVPIEETGDSIEAQGTALFQHCLERYLVAEGAARPRPVREAKPPVARKTSEVQAAALRASARKAKANLRHTRAQLELVERQLANVRATQNRRDKKQRTAGSSTAPEA